MSAAAKFVIVEFTEEGTCGLIPSSWLCQGNQKCHYPEVPSFRIQGLVKKCSQPYCQENIKWAQYPVRILSFANTFEEGSKKSTAAQVTSNLDSDEELGKQKRKRPRRESSSSPEIRCPPQLRRKKIKSTKCHTKTTPVTPVNLLWDLGSEPAGSLRDTQKSALDVHQLPISKETTPCFQLAAGSGTSTATIQAGSSQELISLGTADQTIHDANNSTSERNPGNLVPLNETPSSHGANATETSSTRENEQPNVAGFEKTVLRALSIIQEDLVKIKSVLAIGGTNKEQDNLPIPIPLDSVRKFERANVWLQENANRIKLVSILGQIGGETEEKIIRGILLRLIGPNLNAHMNFTGKFGKTSLRGTNVYSTIQDSVRAHPISLKCTEATIRKVCSDLLRGHTDRDGGRDRRRNNSTNSNRKTTNPDAISTNGDDYIDEDNVSTSPAAETTTNDDKDAPHTPTNTHTQIENYSVPNVLKNQIAV